MWRNYTIHIYPSSFASALCVGKALCFTGVTVSAMHTRPELETIIDPKLLSFDQ